MSLIDSTVDVHIKKSATKLKPGQAVYMICLHVLNDLLILLDLGYI